MAKVPDTTTFNLKDVTNAVLRDSLSGRNLLDCLLYVIPWGYDSYWKDYYFTAYSANNMLMFRNYDGDVDTIYSIGNGSFWEDDASGTTSQVHIASSYQWTLRSYSWGGGPSGWFSFPSAGLQSDENGNPYNFTLNVNNPDPAWVGAGVTLRNEYYLDTIFVAVGILAHPS